MNTLIRRKILIFSFVGAIAAPLASFAQNFINSKHSKAVINTQAGKHEFVVELARTEEQQALGLMFRRSLRANAGMLFDYRTPTFIRMWMKNTYVPLDMIFIGSDGYIRDIVQRTIPHSEAIITSTNKVRAVLEVNAGTVAKLNIQIGDKVEHSIFNN